MASNSLNSFCTAAGYRLPSSQLTTTSTAPTSSTQTQQQCFPVDGGQVCIIVRNNGNASNSGLSTTASFNRGPSNIFSQSPSITQQPQQAFATTSAAPTLNQTQAIPVTISIGAPNSAALLNDFINASNSISANGLNTTAVRLTGMLSPSISNGSNINTTTSINPSTINIPNVPLQSLTSRNQAIPLQTLASQIGNSQANPLQTRSF